VEQFVLGQVGLLLCLVEGGRQVREAFAQAVEQGGVPAGQYEFDGKAAGHAFESRPNRENVDKLERRTLGYEQAFFLVPPAPALKESLAYEPGYGFVYRGGAYAEFCRDLAFVDLVAGLQLAFYDEALEARIYFVRQDYRFQLAHFSYPAESADRREARLSRASPRWASIMRSDSFASPRSIAATSCSCSDRLLAGGFRIPR